MRVLIQRVLSANVCIDNNIKSQIGKGLLLLLGITNDDSKDDIEWLCKKITQLRIFSDSEGKMNMSALDGGLEYLVVSQFTLYASTKKGNRPSYTRAAKPEISIPLYRAFVNCLEDISGKPVATGAFGADMKVSLVNDGPVTILLDSKNRSL